MKSKFFFDLNSFSGTATRIFSGSLWNALQNLWTKGIAFIGTIVIVRLLDREAFGQFGMLNSTVAMFALFASFSSSQMATKYIAENRESDKSKTGRIIGLSYLLAIFFGLILFLLLYLLSDFISIYSLNEPKLAPSLRLMAIGPFFGSVNGAQNGILAGFEAYRDNALFSGVMSSFILVVKIILTSLYALDGAVLSMILEPIFLFSGLYFVSRGILKKNDVKIIFRSSLKDFDLIINYGLPSILVGLIVFPTNWHVLSLMTKIEGGYYEVGFYNIANQWFNLLVFIPYILASTFLPVFTTLLRENNSRAVNKIIINAILILILIFLPGSIFFLFFGNSISQLIYGSDYYGSGPVIALSIFTLIPQGISIVLSNLTSASGKMWFTFWVNLLWALVLLMLVYSFSQLNSMNLTLAKLIAFSFNSVVMIIFYMRWKKRILN